MGTRRAFIGSSLAATCTQGRRRDVTTPALFEFRTYEMRAGRRDVLIDLFETAFLDEYEKHGAHVLATFRDVDFADRWVWMRAFEDGRARGRALTAFYSSDIWRRLRVEANTTIRDTRNALLLRMVSGDIADAESGQERRIQGGIIVSSVQIVPFGSERAHARAFADYAMPLLHELGGAPFATMETDRSQNCYPRQAVRPESVFVTLTRFESRERHEEFLRQRETSRAWRDDVKSRLGGPRAPEIMRLAPTTRSRMR